MARGATVIFNCEHGFYTFVPEDMDDQAYFEANTGVSLTRMEGGELTFQGLVNLPCYSLKGQPFGNLTANVNCCGSVAEVMRANGFVWDYQNKQLAELKSIVQNIALYAQENGAYIALNNLPQAGAQYDGKKLLSFSGVSRFGNQQFILRTFELC